MPAVKLPFGEAEIINPKQDEITPIDNESNDKKDEVVPPKDDEVVPPKDNEQDKEGDDDKKDEVVPPKEEEPIDDAKSLIIDDGNGAVTYELDENGNAVKDGEIVYTADQIKEWEDASDNVLLEASKLSGIEVVDESGNPIAFELTPEHIADRDVAIKNIGKKEGWEEGFNQFLNANPEIASIINYKQRYGTIEGYSEYEDYSSIKLNAEDQSQLEDVIYKAEIRRGRTPDKAKEFVEWKKANNSLLSEAEDSLDYLTKSQTEEQKHIIAQRQAEQQAQLEDDQRWAGVKLTDQGFVPIDAPGSIYDTVVNKGKVKDLVIPKEGVKIKTDKGAKVLSRKDIFQYMAVPIKEVDGIAMSQAQIDIYNMVNDPEAFAHLAILNLAGHDALVKAKLEDEKIKAVRKVNVKQRKVVPQTKRVDENNQRIILPTGVVTVKKK